MKKNEDTALLCNEYTMDTFARQATIVRGRGSRVWDQKNNQYLDFTSGISVHNAGHCHPKIVDAIKSQAETLAHCSNLFYTPKNGLLAQRLSSMGLGGKVFFSNSGAEANETMVKMARLYGNKDGRYEIICMKGSFHGRTLGMISATGQSKVQTGFDPLLPGFRFADFNDLESVKALVNDHTVAIMLEAVQGEGGINPATPEFMQGVRNLCNEKGLLMLCDEIQCGLGRTGKMFGFDHYGVKPDACTLGKSIGGGLPMGVLLATPECSGIFTPGSHGTTMGGNPLACASALAFLDVYAEERLADHSEKYGELFKQGLQKFVEDYDEVLEIRGIGLMLGLVMKGSAQDVVDELRAGGLLALTAGEHVVRLLPPLNITDSDLEEGIEMIGDTFDIMFGEDADEE
jgi:acetylornithine/N-succinyldiaminopimelate aminotransferase